MIQNNLIKIGLICSDGKYSDFRKNELIGCELEYIKKSFINSNIKVEILTTDTKSTVADVVILSSEQLNQYTDLIVCSCGVSQWGGTLVYSQYLKI